jgi:hypothetical protein
VPRLSQDQWAAIRTEWEGEPQASFLGIANRYGVQASSISRRAIREGWAKRGQLASINEAAQRKADAEFGTESKGETQNKSKGTVADLAARDQSEDLRAAVLTRHRREWAELEIYRRHALLAMDRAKDTMDMAIAGGVPASAQDKDAWVAAKTAADTAKANMTTLQIKQDGERKAWGLDDAAIRIDVTRASDEELAAMVKGRG